MLCRERHDLSRHAYEDILDVRPSPCILHVTPLPHLLVPSHSIGPELSSAHTAVRSMAVSSVAVSLLKPSMTIDRIRNADSSSAYKRHLETGSVFDITASKPTRCYSRRSCSTLLSYHFSPPLPITCVPLLQEHPIIDPTLSQVTICISTLSLASLLTGTLS